MKQYMKISLKLIWDHLLIIILSFFLLYPFGWLIQKQNGLLIYSSIMSLLYFSFIYSEVWAVGKRDSKPYSENMPYLMKGMVFGIFASFFNVIVVALFFIAKAGVFNYDIMNIIYRGWMASFVGFFEFFGKSNDMIFWLVLLVLPVASTLGYIAGLNDFSIQDNIIRIFKNKPKNK